MYKEYALFDIRIRGAGPERFEVEVQSPLGGDASGTFTSPQADPAFQQLAQRLQALDTDEDMLVEIGSLLFTALFQGAVKDAYIQARSRLSDEQGLRLRFNVDPALLAVVGLPWEFLYDPSEGPLVLLDAPIVRYLPQLKPPPVLTAALPLKVLLTAAITEPKFDVQRELAEVRAALADLEARGLVQIVIEEHLTRPKLQQLIRQGSQIWHFIGHGQLSRDGSASMLVLEDADGEPEPISARELGIFLNRSGLRLIILDACNSAQLTTQPYRSIAPVLMQAQVGAVVAMQFKAPQEATRPFAGEFYRTLAEGFPIDACVTEGRKAVMLETGLRNPDWGIPAVYTRAPDGRLFAPESSPTSTAAPATAAPAAAQAGGVNISIGSGNTIQSSPINISNIGNTTVSAPAASSAYEARLAELGGVIAGLRRTKNLLDLRAAKMQLDVGGQIQLEETTEQLAAQQQALLELRQARLAELQQLAAQPAGQADAQLAAQIGDLRATVVEEAIEIKRGQITKLVERRKIQPSDRDRARVQAQIDALEAEIVALRQ